MSKEMVLCRVKIKWEREPVLTLTGKEVISRDASNESFVAVRDSRGCNASEFRHRAADIALEARVGPKEYQETVGAEVVSVDILGLVRVEG